MFFWYFSSPWIRIRIPNPDPDPETRLNTDPIRIRIRNTAFLYPNNQNPLLLLCFSCVRCMKCRAVHHTYFFVILVWLCNAVMLMYPITTACCNLAFYHNFTITFWLCNCCCVNSAVCDLHWLFLPKLYTADICSTTCPPPYGGLAQPAVTMKSSFEYLKRKLNLNEN